MGGFAADEARAARQARAQRYSIPPSQFSASANPQRAQMAMTSSRPAVGVLLFTFTCVFLASVPACSGRVLEFGEEFLTRDAGQAYLIKFYAPWCGHCRSMEAAYERVSELLAGSAVTVGRIDATVHQAAASYFRVRGFPTVIYVKGETRHEFRGERTADEMVKFVNRVSGDPVKLIASSGKFNEVLATSARDSFFLFIGDEKSEEFAVYNGIAGQMRTDGNFYRASPDLLPSLDLPAKQLDPAGDPALPQPCALVFKDGGFLAFPGGFDNDSLGVWMTNERFLVYPKVGEFLFYSLYPSTKLLVAVVINESDPEQQWFAELGRRLAFRMDPALSGVQFAWSGSAKAASDLAMTLLPTPNVIMLNPNTSQYFLRPEYHLPATKSETVESLQRLVAAALTGELGGYGGSSLWEGLKRTVYDFVTGLASFVVNHPGLALIVIGAPVGVVSILCYALCCMDTAEAEDESAGGLPVGDEDEDEDNDTDELAGSAEDAGNHQPADACEDGGSEEAEAKKDR